MIGVCGAMEQKSDLGEGEEAEDVYFCLSPSPSCVNV
jgi:hypothetical protein